MNRHEVALLERMLSDAQIEARERREQEQFWKDRNGENEQAIKELSKQLAELRQQKDRELSQQYDKVIHLANRNDRLKKLACMRWQQTLKARERAKAHLGEREALREIEAYIEGVIQDRDPRDMVQRIFRFVQSTLIGERDTLVGD